MSKDSFENAKAFIEKAGFSHIKIEMEADLGREDCDYECSECYGDGYVDCYECDGTGVVIAQRPNGSEKEVECDICDGEGRIECEECGGTGRCGGDEWSDDECETFVFEHVSDEAREACNYSRFYYDGSVDSEMTLTLPVNKAEYLVEYLEAFNKLADAIGNDMSTYGAGLHITVIPKESNGYYPAPHNTLDITKWRNFKNENTKLLPALFLLASCDEVSRELGYRTPRISSEEKYSAIYAKDRASIEYRLFETCYQKPEHVKEYIEVIANTLRYYHNPNLKVKTLNKEFNLYNRYGDNSVNRFYKSAESIKILRNQLKYVKPSDKTIKDILSERKMFNVTEFRKNMAQYRKDIIEQWREIQKRNEIAKQQPLTDYQMLRIRQIKADIASGNSYYGSMTDKQIEERVRDMRELPKLSQFVSRKMREYLSVETVLAV